MHEDCTPAHGYAATREAAMAAFAKKLAVGISGAGQAEQATRQRWPPPAPRLRRLLRCHPAGWQSGRGGLSTGATVGRGDRGEAATTADRPRELFVMLRGPGGRPRLDSERFRSAPRT
jgi:hypothetical protein